MIKKNTKVIFIDGDYEGVYDWQGGIPLSVGEVMAVKFSGRIFEYKLSEKEVCCDAESEDQIVNVVYKFQLENL